jgi:uncharacterized membrane protein (UPF0136 family)
VPNLAELCLGFPLLADLLVPAQVVAPRPIVVAGLLAIGLYAALLMWGGVTGYRRAGSQASLIAGTVTSFIALIALLFGLMDFRLGFELGAILALLMAIFFGIRYAKTRKPMPAAVLAGVSLALALMLGVGLALTWSS